MEGWKNNQKLLSNTYTLVTEGNTQLCLSPFTHHSDEVLLWSVDSIKKTFKELTLSHTQTIIFMEFLMELGNVSEKGINAKV